MLIGLGGLGCPAAQYLVASGVSELLICDFDTVSESNLARQILYTPDDVGQLKTEIARKRLAAQNPSVSVTSYDKRVEPTQLNELVGAYDLIFDASDNYGTRLAVNRACLNHNKPWVMGACIRQEAQVMLFDWPDASAPCYRCIYGNAPETLEDCPGAGIFAPVAGQAGIFMAHIGLSFLAGLEVPHGLNLLDAQQMTWRRLVSEKNPDCRECACQNINN
jgi:adenylyltransferase/sulfurtransferase